MAYISEKLREQVHIRAHYRCEYCQTQAAIVVSMQIDHIKPESLAGKTVLDNLCLTCSGCNAYKLDFQTALDPETKQEVALFNPRLQAWSEHFEWNDDGTLLMGKTAIGRATIERLKINRLAVTQARTRWVKAGWHPPQ